MRVSDTLPYFIKWAERLANARPRWRKELSEHNEYPAPPELALRGPGPQIQQVLLPAQLRNPQRSQARGRVAPPYSAGGDWLTPVRANPKATTKGGFLLQRSHRCLSIISDKSIIGGVVNRAREIRLRGEGARTPGNKTGGSGEKVDESGKQAFRRTKQRKQKSLAERPWPANPPLPGQHRHTVDVHNLTHF